MLLWHFGLIGLSILLLVVFSLVLIRYFSLRKMMKSANTGSNDDSMTHDVSVESTTLREQQEERALWLALLQKQKVICTDLLSKVPSTDFQNKAALSCWSIFLGVEIQIVQHSIPQSKVIDLLDAFKSLLEKIDKAQEVDSLFKSLKVNQSILNELNKVIQRAEDKVASQVNITSELHAKLDKLNQQLAGEHQLDESLAALRVEMAALCEFFERLKLYVNEAKKNDSGASYIETIESFLGSTDDSSFLKPMHSELDSKVSDLKQLAEHQKNIITELKEQIRKVKGSVDAEGRHVGAYDISIARLEKTLLDSSHVIKRLESKLENLQAIKYNLNIDVMKRDEALKQKEAELRDQENGSAQGMDIYGVFDEERNTMKNMEDLLHQDDFTEESDVFASEQASKISSLRLMVNESELYVQMLENDLDSAKALREKLQYQIQNPDEHVSGLDDGALLEKDEEEIENLKEINHELENERRKLALELKETKSQSAEFDALQKKVDELDEKIEVIQEKYVEMEDRYLTALMSKE